jgi:nitroreductase
MDLVETLRTTGAVREFRDEPVPDDVLWRVLDTARFAPSGGNRQGWRVVVVKDPETRRQLRELYLMGWYEYVAIQGSGMTAWAPTNDRAAEAQAVSKAPELAAQALTRPGGFAERLDEVPALLVLLADLQVLAATDRDLDRYTFAGGASIYPFAWNLLLAARSEGLGGVITTIAIRQEPDLKRVLGAPNELAVAAVLALGYPTHQPRRLTRSPVDSFTTIDHLDGAPFAP